MSIDARSGDKQQVELFPMSLYAGVIYGLLLFVVVAAIWAWSNRTIIGAPALSPAAAWTPPPARPAARRAVPTPAAPRPNDSTMARLAELKKLRAADMVSEAEYQQKRSEILKDL
jgi:hypothetical protein